MYVDARGETNLKREKNKENKLVKVFASYFRRRAELIILITENIVPSDTQFEILVKTFYDRRGKI